MPSILSKRSLLRCALAWGLCAGLVSPASAQPTPVPGDCGGYGGRACAIGAPAEAIGMPAGPATAPVLAAPAYAEPAGTADRNAPPPPPDNGFSWSQRAADGSMLDCRRGLDGTPRCDAQPVPGAANAPNR